MVQAGADMTDEVDIPLPLFSTLTVTLGWLLD